MFDKPSLATIVERNLNATYRAEPCEYVTQSYPLAIWQQIVLALQRSEAALSARAPHWVFAAAEACRPHVMKISDGRTEWARDHLLGMLDQIKAGMSPTKACRWLGWIQACMCFAGINTLQDVKDINRAANWKKP